MHGPCLVHSGIPTRTQLAHTRPSWQINTVYSPAVNTGISGLAELTWKLRPTVLVLQEFDPKLLKIILCQLELFSSYYLLK